VSTCFFHGLASDKNNTLFIDLRTLFTYVMLTCTLIYFLKFVVAKTLDDLDQALLWQKFTVVVYMYMYPLLSIDSEFEK